MYTLTHKHTYSCGARLCDIERRSDRHGRIRRVPSRVQNPEANFTRERLAASGREGRKGDRKGVGCADVFVCEFSKHRQPLTLSFSLSLRVKTWVDGALPSGLSSKEEQGRQGGHLHGSRPS